MTSPITKTQYLLDLANSQIEIGACKDIAAGFRTLAALPEYRNRQERQYFKAQAGAFEGRAFQCNEFLKELSAIDTSQLIDEPEDRTMELHIDMIIEIGSADPTATAITLEDLLIEWAENHGMQIGGEIAPVGEEDDEQET